MMKNKLLITLFSLALVSNTGGFSTTSEMTVEDSSDAAVNIQALLQEYMDENETIGASVGFINNGKIEFFSYGKKAIQEDSPITAETIFEIGSITKVFTTLALADMAASGTVQLDDPIENYLPNVKIPEAEGKKITLRHLASHTSGLPCTPDNLDPKNWNNPYEDYTAEHLYNYLNQCTLTSVPGESFEYSNLGMALLGHILSVRSGKSYEQLIKELISGPLGMKNTTISLTPEMDQNFSRGHHLHQEASYWDFSVLAGCGAFRSNVKDMTCFLAANMGLSKSPLVNLLQRCHQIEYELSPTLGIGLGWITSQSEIWHNGGTGGFRSYLGFNPKTQRGIVILSNSTDDWPDELGRVLLDPSYHLPFVDKNLANDSDYLNKFSGSYEVILSDNLTKQNLQVSVKGKTLLAAFSEKDVITLYPESIGVFGVKGAPGGKIYFTCDEEGNVLKIQALLSNEMVWETLPETEEINGA